jgi:putative redox protein
MLTVTVEETGTGLYTQSIVAGRHHIGADEPVDNGGADAGPSPYELLLSALGACTSITVRMYAQHKKWDLKRILVKLTHEKQIGPGNVKVDAFTRELVFEGNLDDTQRQRLLEIANKCPVHKTLTEDPRPVVETRLAG